MARVIDLGKLVKLVCDRHEEFERNHPVAKWGGTPLAHRENREYRRIVQMHHEAVEGKVSFNPVVLYRVRRHAKRYLRHYTGWRLDPTPRLPQSPS